METIKLKVLDEVGHTLMTCDADTEVSLVYTNEYHPGDRVALEIDHPGQYCVVQFEDTMPPALVYVVKWEINFHIPFGEQAITYSPKSFAGIGGMILLFPVSVFWAVLFGFWLPGLAAMQTLFPALRSEYGVEVRFIPRPTAPEYPLSAQEQKKRSRANWWYYHWGIVAVAAVVAVSVVYAAHGLMTAVDPDYTVAVVTAESLPDEAVQNLQSALEQYADDANGDGTVLVQANNYTWSANASLTDMNGQMAGATQMNTDLANGESKLWILEDPEGFEHAYGALSENLGADWASQLIDWSDQPVLSSLDLGSYNTAADGSQSVTVQSCFARCKIAVLDPADGLWHALSS